MGRVVAIVKILPEDIDTQPEDLVKLIERELPVDIYHVLRSRVEPIAYGINAIYLWIAMPETIEGGTFDLENRLSSIQGIGQVDVISISRMIE
ncbi:MAG: elongation factor 1-beta [Thermofilaceae archaeon]|nr:elongation factor 1-beta [Thermofilaceae archaeon]MCX8180591.1 elongation factor 1-beta [Thermofilaceae archaeon]MDW8003693.1 elongation factor 1-beta [Thermofilaceae archaeon]